MRALITIAMVAAGFAHVTAVRAADLPIDGTADYSTRQTAVGYPAGSIVVYDYQSGVVVRSYWRAPWRHRHYFPVTGTPPEIGRDEDLSAPSEPPEPAQTFRRHWSTSSAFDAETPRGRVPPLNPPLK
jgi:hypothetical protein